MRKILLALGALMFSILVTVTGANAAPVSASSTAAPAVVGLEGLTSALPVHWRGPKHNCRRHGHCGAGFHFGPGGLYIGPGYYNYHGSYSRGCRGVRRWCRREWGGGKRYRRCVRRQDCRP